MATRMRYFNVSCFATSATVLPSIMHPEYMREIDSYLLIAPILRGCEVEREQRCYLTFKQPTSIRKINTIYDLTLWRRSSRLSLARIFDTCHEIRFSFFGVRVDVIHNFILRINVKSYVQLLLLYFYHRTVSHFFAFFICTCTCKYYFICRVANLSFFVTDCLYEIY